MRGHGHGHVLQRLGKVKKMRQYEYLALLTCVFIALLLRIGLCVSLLERTVRDLQEIPHFQR